MGDDSKTSCTWFQMGNKIIILNERFIKGYNENSDRGYFLEVDVEYPKNLFNSHEDLSFLTEIKKLRKVKKLVCGTEDKKNMLFTQGL